MKKIISVGICLLGSAALLGVEAEAQTIGNPVGVHGFSYGSSGFSGQLTQPGVQQFKPSGPLLEPGAQTLQPGASGTQIQQPQPMPAAGRVTVEAPATTQGKSVPVPTDILASMCADIDGCQVRLAARKIPGKRSTDPTKGDFGRIYSNSTLLFINVEDGQWRTQAGKAGQDVNSKEAVGGNEAVVGNEHPLVVETCYFTDGEYEVASQKDDKIGFGLLSWTPYEWDCVLTLID